MSRPASTVSIAIAASARRDGGIKLSFPVSVFFRPHPESSGGDASVLLDLASAQKKTSRTLGGKQVSPDCVFKGADDAMTVFGAISKSLLLPIMAGEGTSVVTAGISVILAYGVSGSGKTYNIDQILIAFTQNLLYQASERQSDVNFGAVEIYGSGKQEGIRDLFGSTKAPQAEKKFDKSHIVSDAGTYQLVYEKRPLVTGGQVQDGHFSVQMLLNEVKERRATRRTARNDGSSRSHCVYVLSESRGTSNSGACIYLFDLAGSERQGTDTTKDATKEEATWINYSLSEMRTMFKQLNEQSVTFQHRQGSLNRILGGLIDRDAKIAVMCTIKHSDCVSTASFPNASSLTDIDRKKFISDTQSLNSGSWEFGLACKRSQPHPQKMAKALENIATTLRATQASSRAPLQGEAETLSKAIRDLEAVTLERDEGIRTIGHLRAAVKKLHEINERSLLQHTEDTKRLEKEITRLNWEVAESKRAELETCQNRTRILELEQLLEQRDSDSLRLKSLLLKQTQGGTKQISTAQTEDKLRQQATAMTVTEEEMNAMKSELDILNVKLVNAERERDVAESITTGMNQQRHSGQEIIKEKEMEVALARKETLHWKEQARKHGADFEKKCKELKSAEEHIQCLQTRIQESLSFNSHGDQWNGDLAELRTIQRAQADPRTTDDAEWIGHLLG